jgi:F0F1-type ATP synthase alpha subunit
LTFFPLSKPPAAAAALLLSALALAACGESAQEKAMAKVCAARSDISKQVTKLEGLTFSASTLNEAKASFEAIGKDLSEMNSQQSALAPARKEQVQAGTRAFESQLATVAAGLASSLGSGNLEAELKKAEPQLKSAVSKLAADYKQALGPISCS